MTRNPDESLLTAKRDFASVSVRTSEGWTEYHGLQIQWNRRLKNGIGFGVNDTYSIYQRSDIGWRLKHAADGSYTLRDDMAKAYRHGPKNPHPLSR